MSEKIDGRSSYDSYLIRFGSTIIPKILFFWIEKQNHRPSASETLGVGPRNLWFNKPSWWFWCSPMFENHWYKHTHKLSLLFSWSNNFIFKTLWSWTTRLEHLALYTYRNLFCQRLYWPLCKTDLETWFSHGERGFVLLFSTVFEEWSNLFNNHKNLRLRGAIDHAHHVWMVKPITKTQASGMSIQDPIS